MDLKFNVRGNANLVSVAAFALALLLVLGSGAVNAVMVQGKLEREEYYPGEVLILGGKVKVDTPGEIITGGKILFEVQNSLGDVLDSGELSIDKCKGKDDTYGYEQGYGYGYGFGGKNARCMYDEDEDALAPLKAGNYSVKFSYLASNGAVAATDLVRFLVPNLAPEWVEEPEDQAIPKGGYVSYQVQAMDANGDKITYSVDDPDFSMDPDSGLLEWTPPRRFEGERTVTVSASDGELTTSEDITIFVNSEIECEYDDEPLGGYHEHQPHGPCER